MMKALGKPVRVTSIIRMASVRFINMFLEVYSFEILYFVSLNFTEYFTVFLNTSGEPKFMEGAVPSVKYVSDPTTRTILQNKVSRGICL